jgi:uncharacterized flavoprotein (TIGR03862 family)
MAAEIVSAKGVPVAVYDRMASAGRKFLLAGRGGLNLTHSEDFETFVPRYGAAAENLRPILEEFPPAALIAWAHGLGQETFVGTSGRVFPKAMKASPLLRAWLARLGAQGVAFRMRQEWCGWDETGALIFRTPSGMAKIRADAVVLALGGASWPKLGSDGGWADILRAKGVAVSALKPANCGFAVPWSDIFRNRFAGAPLKNIAITFGGRTVRGECVITNYGIEGGAIYALSAPLREAIAATGKATVTIDPRPGIPEIQLQSRLARTRGKDSLANFLRKALRLSPLEINLLREAHGAGMAGDASALAQGIKSLPLTLTAPQGTERAISTAGGIAFSALDENLMLRAVPGVFAAGEMLDFEAPTGGYLLQGAFASGVRAARGVLQYLRETRPQA